MNQVGTKRIVAGAVVLALMTVALLWTWPPQNAVDLDEEP